VSDLKPPGWHIVGLGGPAVVVPGRVAAWLETRLDLRRVRSEVRGIDPEIDSVLLDLAVAALTWRKAVDGCTPAGPTEVGAPSVWLTTADAADQLGISSSWVRQEIRAKHLAAEQVDRRWRISRTDFEHYRAARAA
jgi:excisionase family DNA binding protein